MARTLALLRGINVGGKTVKMDRLKALFEGMGFTGVYTYIQSGNVLFDTAGEPEATLPARVEECLRTQLGFDVPVVLLSPGELNGILNANPYKGRLLGGGERVHVTILSDVPTPEAAGQLSSDPRSADEFMLVGRAAYILCKNGYHNTAYSNSFFERKLKAKATTRNMDTMMKLAELAGAPRE